MAMKRTCFIAVVLVILAGTCLAQSARQVEVVAEVALTNQTGNTGGILFTPNQTGMFRVSFYLQCTKGSEILNTELDPVVLWTDDNGNEFEALPPVQDNSIGPPESAMFIIKAIAGTPVSWNVQPNRLRDKSRYEVYLALEHIGPTVQ
jgi:hypothetical protein